MLKISFFCFFIGIGSYQLSFAQTPEFNFQEELSTFIIGSPVPIDQNGTGLYIGVVLSPPGASWALASADFESRTGAFSASVLAKEYNFPVSILGGVVAFNRTGGYGLESTWERLLSDSIPETVVDNQERASIDVLYRPVDRVDEARELTAREPSSKYLRYKEYESAYELLVAGESRGDKGAWQLHPRFQGYRNLESAIKGIEEEWKLFGHRDEIEMALTLNRQTEIASGQAAWKTADTLFRRHTLSLRGVRSGLTYFFPPEPMWPSMGGWTDVGFNFGVMGSRVKCQISRVEIRRPWLSLALVSSSNTKFRLRSGSDLGIVSDGGDFARNEFPNGIMANIVTELILVRNVGEIETDTSLHPLARYAGRAAQEINLLGFVITSLPIIQAVA
jgi:hypothetical protein